MSLMFSLVFGLASFAAADLRMASQPHQGYFLRDQGTTPWTITPYSVPIHYRYMEPSTFDYKGLENQKRRNYDNFLRSNIDNEQDNRNFNEEPGKDHLPFRTMETDVHGAYKRYVGRVNRINQEPREIDLMKEVKPGDSMSVPLRWNNPHSSEMEVNIWIFEHASKQPIVVPIRKPSCSGEGYQDNIISFTVPSDFSKLGAKIPGFKGCNEDSKPMCTLQIYSHSVESRTYAIGFPIVIPGHDTSLTTSENKAIKGLSDDPWLEIQDLRDTCLPATDPSATISTSEPKWARLVSDVYNHAYQNSDYSPYSGQQHELISKNLQASAINKMEVGNRGELGKSILPSALSRKLAELRRLEDRVYKNYEALANKIINSLGNQMKNTGTVGVQQLANCFRCGETGSTNTKRLQTNTYIPSFQLPDSLQAAARKLVPTKYAKLITESGLVQIYNAAMNDLLPFFYKARTLGVIYQEAMVKTTIGTLTDVTNFTKVDKDGKVDGGKYASLEAKKAFVAAHGCPSQCLHVKAPSLLQEDSELSKPSTWAPSPEAKMGGRWIRGSKPVTLKLDLGNDIWIVGLVDGRHLKMTEMQITGEKTYKWIASRYTSSRDKCAQQANLDKYRDACFKGRDLRASSYYTAVPPFAKQEGATAPPSIANSKAWFCVASRNRGVSGPFPDVESAKTELNKTAGSRGNRQMICEMSASGAKSDPHRVGSQNQGAGTRASFNKYWINWGDIRGMNSMCNADAGCKLNLDSTQIMKPLVSSSAATNVTGECAPCVQFFGKKVHEIKEPPLTPLAAEVSSISSSGVMEVPSSVDKSIRLEDNPEEGSIYAAGNYRRRRRRDTR